MLIYDASRTEKIAFAARSGPDRVCIWSEPAPERRGVLPDLRHFILVDVLVRRLRRRGVSVDHVVGSGASRFEAAFCALGVTLPEHFAQATLRPDQTIASWLPGAPAEELFTSAHPPPPSQAESGTARRRLITNSAIAAQHDLYDQDGRPLRRAAEVEPDGPLIDDTRVAGTLSDLASWDISAAAFRLHCLRTHYRRPVSFSQRSLLQSARSLDLLADRVGQLLGTTPSENSATAYVAEAAILDALDDDVNTARAIAVLHTSLANPAIRPGEKLELVVRAEALLGLALTDPAATQGGARRGLQLVA